jgi:hypothetical protein
MKIILSLTLIMSLLFLACEPITDPVSNPDSLKKSDWSPNNQSGNAIRIAIIPLPEKSPIYLDSIFTISQTINGLLGGTITLDKAYVSKEGRLVTILVSMVVPPLAFLGQRDITVTIEDSIAVMDCGPSMTFQRSLICLQTFTGLDLSDYNTEEIDFMYIHDDGRYTPIPRSSLLINKPLGLVSVISARINHFSKYGWVRKSGNSN